MSFRPEDLDADEILKKRLQRFRIENTIFEDDAVTKGSNGEMCSAETADVGGVLKLVQSTQSIDFKRVGVDVFDLSGSGKIFDNDQLHKNLCESKPSNMINHPLFHISNADLHEVILRGLLKQPMKNQVIYSHINKYLFFLISCHCSTFLVDASCETLMYHVLTSSSEKKNSPKWIPSMEDILMLFCNYGASRELLSSWDTPLLKRELSNEVMEDSVPDSRIKNIPWVLKVISLLLMNYKSTCYSVEELDSLLSMILTISLDKYVIQMQSVGINLEFSKCVKCILTAYPSSNWQKQGKVSELSRALYRKFRNVALNDAYFIINNYIICPGFGQKLALSLMYAFVQGTLRSSDSIIYVDDIAVKHIRKIFKVDSLLNMDYYTQYYVLLMVENVITNMIFTLKDSKELKRIRQLLSNLRIKSPHSEDMVDYLLVKELITRAATTWKLSVAELS